MSACSMEVCETVYLLGLRGGVRIERMEKDRLRTLWLTNNLQYYANLKNQKQTTIKQSSYLRLTPLYEV